MQLTKEFFKTRQIAFFPATAGEAIYIQQRLAEMGLRWKSGTAVVTECDDIIKRGLVLQNGKMFIGNADIRNEYIVCDVRALSPYIDMPTLALEQRVAELEQQVAELTQALKPTKLSKPATAAAKPAKKAGR